MKLIDILPVEKWIELEKEINRRSGLNASIFYADGISITDFKKWANKLCPVIKTIEKGQNFICSIAHQNTANQAKKTRKPVTVECDAGLVKVVVPIFVYNEFLGVAGGCGLMLSDGEVDSYLINKTTYRLQLAFDETGVGTSCSPYIDHTLRCDHQGIVAADQDSLPGSGSTNSDK